MRVNSEGRGEFIHSWLVGRQPADVRCAALLAIAAVMYRKGGGMSYKTNINSFYDPFDAQMSRHAGLPAQPSLMT